MTLATVKIYDVFRINTVCDGVADAKRGLDRYASQVRGSQIKLNGRPIFEFFFVFIQSKNITFPKTTYDGSKNGK